MIVHQQEELIPEGFERNQMFLKLMTNFIETVENNSPARTFLKEIIEGQF